MKRKIFGVFAIIGIISCSGINLINGNTATVNMLQMDTREIEPIQIETDILLPTISPSLMPSPTSNCPPKPDSKSEKDLGQTKLGAWIPNVKVVWYDTFKCEDYSYGWWSPNTNPENLISIQDSILKLQEENSNDDIASIIRTSYDIVDGKGMAVLFRYSYGSSISIFIDTGELFEPSYKGWGLAVDIGDNHNNYWYNWKGQYLQNIDLPLNILHPNIWYYFLIKLGKNADISMEVLKQDQLEVKTNYHYDLNDEWAHHGWKVVFQVFEGEVEVDDYWQFEQN